MKKISALLFSFLISFYFTSCISTNSSSEFSNDEKILQIGYDFITLPTEVSEDFELPSYYNYELGKIEFYYLTHDNDIIKITRTPKFQNYYNENAVTMACITRNEKDVDVLIHCYIKFADKVKIKLFQVTVLGLENDEIESPSQKS